LIIIANEQTPIPNGISVNALHITDTLGTSVVLSHAESDIHCAAPCQQAEHDFVTGSGEERGSSDGKSQFGFDAGHEDDTSTPPKGHMAYNDNLAGVKVLSTDVTSYSVDALNQRTFGGHATYNGAPGYTYKAIVQDNAGRGMGLDTFSISVFDPSSVLVYANSGTISAGIIEIHN